MLATLRVFRRNFTCFVATLRVFSTPKCKSGQAQAQKALKTGCFSWELSEKVRKTSRDSVAWAESVWGVLQNHHVEDVLQKGSQN